jgi:uncharacterized membrane protein (DUF106 family)
MARTARKVDSLADESGMASAMEAVLAQADEHGTVEWADVRENLTSGQWGRLIQKGILVDAGNADGFVLDDPDAVREALDDSGTDGGSSPPTASGDDDEEDSGWSTYDKIAGVLALGLFGGYALGPIRNAIGGTLDAVLGPLASVLPFYMVILVLALCTGLWTSLLQGNMMDTSKVQEYQARMSDIQDRLKDARERDDEAEVDRIREEQMDAMGDQFGMMKAQFRPTVWIMLLTIPVFLWMYWKIGIRGGVSHGLSAANNQLILPLIGEATWTTGVVGPLQAWLLWYFLCSMGFAQIIRKALNVRTTPA